MATSDFYDTLAPYYHLIYADWEVSIGRQSRTLDAIISSTGGPQPRSVLDAACGIGTQSIGWPNSVTRSRPPTSPRQQWSVRNARPVGGDFQSRAASPICAVFKHITGVCLTL
jgi:ubiquinone/menaquinone biosynthesis C-methylase UbiE